MHMLDTVQENTPNVRSVRYTIVESRSRCSQCNAVTTVFALALPAGYESLTAYDDTPDTEDGVWEATGMPAVLSYVEHLSEAVANRVRALTSHYRIDRDIESGHALWMNHCEHCGAAMEEEELHSDLEGPFGPNPYEGLERVRLYEVGESFEGCAARESHNLIPLHG